MSRFIFLNLQQPSEALKQSLEHKVQHKHPKYSCLVLYKTHQQTSFFKKENTFKQYFLSVV